MPAFEGHDVTFVTINPTYKADVPGERVLIVRDSTRWNKLGLIILGFQILLSLIRIRPHIVVSTGAAPGFMAIVLGRLLGAKTVWLDCIANVEEVSMSGRMVRRWAVLWLTQWPHLATDDGPKYAGRVF